MISKVVIDTNILLDLFHFKDESVTDLANLLSNKVIQAVYTPEMIAELKDVLSRPMFEIAPSDQLDILHRYQTIGKLEASTIGASSIRCADPDDQIFIDLAIAISPCELFSKDKHILKLRNRLAKLGVTVRKN